MDRGVLRSQRNGSLRPYSRLSRPEPLLLLPSSCSVVLTRLSGPLSTPTTSQKIWWRLESNPDLWICSQDPQSTDRTINNVQLHPNKRTLTYGTLKEKNPEISTCAVMALHVHNPQRVFPVL
jgi:hypothetical protein